MTTTLSAESIVKHYPTRSEPVIVLNGASLSLNAGEAAAVMGPSGSGKSTLLNILGTLEPPTSGTIALDGVDPYSLADEGLARFRNERVGFVFQEHHLLPQCSVLENVLIPTLPRGGGRGADVERARTLIDRVGLSDRIDHRPAELSGGERQRAAVARALINSPTLLLADEPTGNLDRANADAIGQLLADLPEADGIILIVATHSPELASRMGRRYQLADGKLIEE